MQGQTKIKIKTEIMRQQSQETGRENTVKVTDYEKVTKYIVDFETVDIKGGVVVE